MASDYPYTPASSIAFQVAVIDKEASKLFASEVVNNIYAGNAKVLFK
jgi:hypothetical protein